MGERILSDELHRGIVAENIERAVFLYRAVHRVFYIIGIRDIGLNKSRCPALLHNGVHGGLAPLGIDFDADHVCAFVGKMFGNRLPDSRTTPRHDSNFIFQSHSRRSLSEIADSLPAKVVPPKRSPSCRVVES